MEGFTDLTSPDYTSSYDGIEDSQALETSLENKFAAYDVIYLRYLVNSAIVTGDSGSVSFSWDANSGATGYSRSAVFFFQREEEGWRFSTVQDDNTFLRYTSVAASIVIQADDSELVANNVDTTTVRAEARDSAYNLIADGTAISFTTTLGSIDPVAYTTNGMAEATFSAGIHPGLATITASSGGLYSSPIIIQVKREHAPPTPCEQWMIQGDCETNGCFWDGYSCVLTPPPGQ